MILLFVMLVGLEAIEVFASIFWSPAYFRLGIPVFRATLFCCDATKLSSAWLNEYYRSTTVPPILFKRLSENSIAFRETHNRIAYLFNFLPVMHGLISQETRECPVKLIGYANWLPVLFLIGLTLGMRDPQVLIFAFVFFGIQYVIQLIRFMRLTRLIRTEFGS